MKRILAPIGISLLSLAALKAQVVLGPTGTYTQNFNAITTTLPAGWRMSANTDGTPGANGWSTAVGTVARTVSSLNANSVGNSLTFIPTAADRAIGFLNDADYETPTAIYFAFTNNTGAAITSLEIAFNYEKYRSGARDWTWSFTHGLADDPATQAGAGGQSYLADAGNGTNLFAAPPSVAKSFTLEGLNIAQGATYYLEWTLAGNGGSTNGMALAIDDFSLNVVPEPSASALIALGASVVLFFRRRTKT